MLRDGAGPCVRKSVPKSDVVGCLAAETRIEYTDGVSRRNVYHDISQVYHLQHGAFRQESFYLIHMSHLLDKQNALKNY